MDINDIFRDLGTMVNDQGEMIGKSLFNLNIGNLNLGHMHLPSDMYGNTIPSDLPRAL